MLERSNRIILQSGLEIETTRLKRSIPEGKSIMSSKRDLRLSGSEPENIKKGQLYEIVEGKEGLSMELISEPADLKRVILHLNPKVYNIIKDLSVHHHGTEEVEGMIGDYILSSLEQHLTGTTTIYDISEELGAYIAKRHGYDPKAWRGGEWQL